MLEKITGTFSNIIRTMSGKSTITEKNIEETVEQIKMALLEADVNLRVVRRFVNSTIEEAKGEKVLKSVNPGQQFVKIINDKIVAMLGDIPSDYGFNIAEIHDKSRAGEFTEKFPQLRDYTLFSSSDAHTLLGINSRQNFIELEENSAKCLIESFFVKK